MKRINWEIEEMVAIVDIYYKRENDSTIALEKELLNLSNRLKKRAEMLSIDHDEKFRNIIGMRMIFQNIRFVDTQGETGLSSASQLVYNVVEMYKNDYDRFKRILDEFNIKY